MSERKAPCGTITGMPALDVTWQTPPELVAPVRAYFGGKIPCDAATTEENPCGAETFFTPARSGLTHEWPLAGVWLNPPYGKVLREWFAKVEIEAARGVPIISLLPCARWEQAYFQSAFAAANAVCLIRKRVAFIRPATGDRVGGNPYANMFLAWNVKPALFAAVFASEGACSALSGITGPPEVRRPGPARRPKAANALDDSAGHDLYGWPK